jgi:hypothetical protein
MILNRQKNTPQILALLVGLSSLIMIVLWILPLEMTGTLGFHMKFNTCLSLLLASVALYILNDVRSEVDFMYKITPPFIGILLLAVGLASGAQYLYQIDFGIDQFFVTDGFLIGGRAYPGRMSPTSCVAFILLSVGIFSVSRKASLENKLSYVTTLPLLLFSSIILIGYLYSQQDLYQLGPHIRMAPLTAVNFFILSVGLLFTKLTHSPFEILTSKNLGGVTARKLGLPVVLIPLFLGGLCIEALNHDYFAPKFAVSILVLSIICLLLFLILFTSTKIEKLEISNKTAQNQVDRIQKHFNRVIDNSNLTVWKTDLDLKITFFRGGIKKKFYTHGENLIGGALPDLFENSPEIKRISSGYRK